MRDILVRSKAEGLKKQPFRRGDGGLIGIVVMHTIIEAAGPTLLLILRSGEAAS